MLKWKSKFRVFRKYFSEIPLVDRCLTVFMLILLIQLAYGLFITGEPTPEVKTIDIIVRTSAASIFGYFLSANFIREKPEKPKRHIKTEKTQELENKASAEGQIKNRIGFTAASERQNKSDQEADISLSEYEEEEIWVENRMQILIAASMGLFCLIALLILRNVSDWYPEFTKSESINATISQFRDFISGCVGFLVGSPSVRSK
jgi:hypothetical protein